MNLRHTHLSKEGKTLESYRTRVRRLDDGWYLIAISESGDLVLSATSGPYATKADAEQAQLDLLAGQLSGPGVKARALTGTGKKLLRRVLAKHGR